MTYITIPDALVEQLNASKSVVLCNGAGAPLGTFTPMDKLTEHQRIATILPEHLRQSKVPVEELRRRLREETPIPHEEVMEQLRKYL